MNTMKKITVIFVLILLSASGLLFGCQSLYSKMRLELDTNELFIYIKDDSENTSDEDEILDLPSETGEEEDAELEPEKEDALDEINYNYAQVKVTIKNLPDKVSNKILVNQSIKGVVLVEETEVDSKTNTTTFKITALKAGSTIITFKTEEGNKEVTMPINIIEPIENLELNANYNPMVVVGEESYINTSKVLKYSPTSTNQTSVIYSLVGDEEGVTIDEAGNIYVASKTSNYITVRATSVYDESLFVDISVKVIEAIKEENIKLLANGEEVDSIELATNLTNNSQAEYEIFVQDNSENIDVNLEVSSNNNLDIEKLTNTSFRIRSISRGKTSVYATVSVENFDYSVQKEFSANIKEYPEYISVNGNTNAIQSADIFDNYYNSNGTAFNLSVGPVGAEDKNIKLQIEEEDKEKIEIRRQNGSLLDMDDLSLQNNETIYIKAKTGIVLEDETSVTIQIIAEGSENTSKLVKTTLTINLRKGAQDLQLTSVDNENANLKLEKGQSMSIIFKAVPEDYFLGEVNFYTTNASVVSYAKIADNQFDITAMEVGVTKIYLLSSNGITKVIDVEVYIQLKDVVLNMPSANEDSSVGQKITTLTEANNKTLSSIALSIGVGMPLQVVTYPSNADVVSYSYNSSNINIASISASGYIIAKALGVSNITVDVDYIFDLGNGQSEIRTYTRQFELTVYMPISSIELNHYQATLYDVNSLGYYELYKSQLQLEVNISPANATFNENNVVWSVNSSYATISEDGLLQVALPTEISSATVTVTALVQEYSRYYTQKSIIRIEKPTKVSGISILNVEDRVYFDARNGLGEENISTAGLVLDTRVYPSNASNKTLKYVVIDDTSMDDELNLSEIELSQKAVKVTEDGVVVPLRVGNAIIHIVSEDSYTSPLTYSNYIEIKVRVSDGASEARAIEISSAQDFLDINTPEGLSLHYVLSNTIDLSAVQLTPIGIIDGLDYGFSGSISGDFSVAGYNIQNQIIGANIDITNTDRKNYVGLFSQLINNGTIKNMKVSFSTFNVTLSSNTDSSLSYISPLVARIINGTVENVKVDINSGKINVSNKKTYIGGLGAINDTNGYIINSSVSGDLIIEERQGITITPTIYIGGLAGWNNGVVIGEYDVQNELLIDNFNDYNSAINITANNVKGLNNTLGGLVGYNDTSGNVKNIITNANLTGLNQVGGAVGQNMGLISSVMSSSYVKGNNYVGGLVGYSSGDIENSSVLVFDRFDLNEKVLSQITGNNYVGGLVGKATSSSGAINISYSYVKSFYTRVVDKVLYSGDLLVEIPQTSTEVIYVGGLVGQADNLNLNFAYSEINILVTDKDSSSATSYVGGLVGGADSLLTTKNAYQKGTIIAENNSVVAGILAKANYNGITISEVYVVADLTGDTVKAVVGEALQSVLVEKTYYVNTIASASYGQSKSIDNLRLQATYIDYNFEDVWAINPSYNNGTPYLLYEDSDNAMLIKIPTDITLTVNDGIDNANDIKHNHFKISDDKAIVYYYENGGDLNVYSLDNNSASFGLPIISKQFLPVDVNVQLVKFASSNESIISVSEDGLLTVLGEGVVTITAYSILDKNVYDTFELASVAPVTSFNLKTENPQTNDFEEITATLIIKKDDIKRIYPIIEAKIDGEKYSYNAFTNIYYQTISPVGVSFEEFDWVTSNNIRYTSIANSQAHVMYGDYAKNSENALFTSTIFATPTIEVEFEDGVEVLSLDFLQISYEVEVNEGSTNLTIPYEEVSISLKDIFTLDVELESDTTTTDTTPYTSVTAVKDVERVTENDILVDGSSELIIEKTRISNIDGVITDNYTIKVSDKYSSLYETTQTYIITFASYDKSEAGVPLEGEEPALTKTFVINIIPQSVLRIDSSFYSSNEIFENNDGVFYNPNELPTDYIMAGRIGLFKFNVYPEYSNADYIDLIYSSTQNNTVSFEQVAFVEAESFEDSNGNNMYDEGENYIDENNNGVYDFKGYTAIYPQSESIENGIRLRMLSNRTTDAPVGGIYTYDFDGNVYVRVLIGTEVSNTEEFTFTAIAYNETSEGTLEEMLRKQVVLSVEPSTELTVLYEGNSKLGYIPIGVEKEFTVAVSKLQITNPSSQIKILIKDNNNQTILDTSYSSSNSLVSVEYADKTQSNGYMTDYIFNIKFKYSRTFDFDKTYSIEAIVEKVINNNLQQYKSNTFEIVPTLFTINSIYVENVDDLDNYFTVAFGGIYDLKVKLNASYDESASNVEDIEELIEALEKDFSYLINDNSGTSTWYERKYISSGVEDTMLEISEYNNYIISKDGNNELIKIQPKRISSGDVIVAKVFFNYALEDDVRLPIMIESNLSSVTTENNASSDIFMEYEFKTDFYLRATEENPLPIYDEEGFIEMNEGGHYILMNDLTLGSASSVYGSWEPLTTQIASLDGNSYTITIEEFLIDDENSDSIPISKNFGLFDAITSATTLKNLTVYLPNIELDATLYQEVYFGGVVGQNQGGLIYNSYVYSGNTALEKGVVVTMSATVSGTTTSAYIGGIAGSNSGYIANSRSEVKLTANKGYLAGVVGVNSGNITATYYKNGYIKNTSQTKLNSAVAGLAVFNEGSGKISSSYVEGDVTGGNLEYDENDNATGRILGGGLEFSGNLAGFVYENQGTIKNAYTNIKIVSQARSSGFVFTNVGEIENAYSMSKVAYNVAAHTVFIGTSEQGETLNSGTIKNAYYLEGAFANTIGQPAIKISSNGWANKNNFEGFLFSEDSDESSYGIWAMEEVNLITSPSLISANSIATSKRIIAGQETNQETGEVEYSYTYSLGYELGSEFNPLTIQSANQFNEILSEQGNEFNQYVRLIKDIEFDGSEVMLTSKVEFAGFLDGNDMSVSNISIISNYDNESIGLFKSIDSRSDEKGVIKNINFTFAEVYSNQKTYVGAIAGIIEDGKLYDITINNPSTVVQGKHLVGGVAGLIKGSSHLVNVYVSTSINSTYRENVYTSADYDIYNGSNDSLISYAGAVAGVIDVNAKGVIKNIAVTGNSSVLAENVGGAFGLVGSNTTIENVSVEVTSEQFIRTTKVAGGVVGENRGTIKNATISYEKDVQNLINENLNSQNFGEKVEGQNISFFAGIGQTAGGLVGFNNGGTIQNSTSTIDVRNENIQVVGGLIGRSIGGVVSSSISYGAVLGETVIGGLIGSVISKDLIASDDEYAINLIKAEYRDQLSDTILEINEVYAYNNWLKQDYDMLVNGNSSGQAVVGGLIGAIQHENYPDGTYFITESKTNNWYINSIYNPNDYSEEADWHYISEYGLIIASKNISYAESNQLSNLSDDGPKIIKEGEEAETQVYYYNSTDTGVNGTNELAIGIKLFEVSGFWPL